METALSSSRKPVVAVERAISVDSSSLIGDILFFRLNGSAYFIRDFSKKVFLFTADKPDWSVDVKEDLDAFIEAEWKAQRAPILRGAFGIKRLERVSVDDYADSNHSSLSEINRQLLSDQLLYKSDRVYDVILSIQFSTGFQFHVPKTMVSFRHPNGANKEDYDVETIFRKAIISALANKSQDFDAIVQRKAVNNLKSLLEFCPVISLQGIISA